MSAKIELTDDRLIVHIEGADKLWSLRSRLEVPLAHVSGADPAGPEAHKWWHGIRVAGTNLPGVISAGRFYVDGTWVFWDVHDPDKAIAITLHDERYQRLVVEVEDPDAEIAGIRAAIAGASAG